MYRSRTLVPALVERLEDRTLLAAPAAPTGLTLIDTGDPQQPTIDWADTPEATFYNVWLVNMSTGTLAESATGISSSEFTPSADLAVAPHRIFVRAGNTDGLSNWSAPFDFNVQAASAGFTISETGGATEVSENSDPALPHPETDTFSVVLTDQPAAGTVVVLDVSSSDTGEATVSPAQLTFDSSNWDQPQAVTVQGVNDNLADGNQAVTITVAVNDGLTTDDTFDSLADQTVSATVLDVPVTPEVLGPLTGQTVPNGQVTFTWNDVAGATSYNIWLLDLANPSVVLYFNFNVPPGGSFTLPAADALDPGNYRYFFSANNANGFSDWSGPHDFAVQASASVPAAPTGFTILDSGNPLRPTIDWDDVPGATFYNVWLVNLDTGALAQSASGITTSSFTPSVDLAEARHRIFVRAGNVVGLGNWSAPFDFVVQATASGFTITETGGATEVSENSDPGLPHPETDTFTVVLANPPAAGTVVVLDVSSSDTGEATVSPAQLTFDSSNWDQPQTVTVQGVNDDLADGDQTVTVTVAVNAALTTDDTFDSLVDQTVSVTVLNVPVTPVMLGPLRGDTVSGGEVTFTWNDVPGATSYNIWLLDLANPAVVLYFKFDIPPGGTFTLPAADALDPGNYRYFFSANNANGFSNWSGPHDFTVEAQNSAQSSLTLAPLDMLPAGDIDDVFADESLLDT